MAPIRIPSGEIDLAMGTVVLEGARKGLTPIEVAVLSVLAAQRPEPVSEDTLLERAWGYKTRNTRTVSMGISRLRQKIEVDPRSPQVLLTVRGQGYRFVEAPKPDTPLTTPRRVAAVGRDAEREAVLLTFSENARVVELIGPGGIGKSALARDLLPETAVWVDLGGVRTWPELLRRLTAALETPGADGVEAVRSALVASTRLVIDAAEDLESDARARLSELLENGATRVLLTTREALGVGTPVLLGELGPDAALAVANRARADAGLPPVDASRIAPVLDAFGGHALALVVAAPLLDLDLDVPMLLELGEGGLTLSDVLDQTVQRLDDEPLRVLRAVAACAVPPAVPWLCSLLSLPVASTLRSIHQLRQSGLVALDPTGIHVHPFVRHACQDAAAEARHAERIAAMPLDPSPLRAVRHEVELALQRSRGEIRLAVLLRHLFVLATYGPVEGVTADLAPIVATLPDDARRDVLWGMALFLGGENALAASSLASSTSGLDDPMWAALAWIYLGFTTAHTRDADIHAKAIAALDAVRLDVPDPTVRHLATLQIALERITTDLPGALTLFDEIESSPDASDALALIAGVTRLRYGVPTPGEIRRVEARLEAIGPEGLGGEAFAQRRIHVVQMWLSIGETERGLAILDAVAPEYLASGSVLAKREVCRAAAYALDTPDVARHVLALCPDDFELARGLVWVLEGEGDVPVEDADLARLLLDFREGRPVSPDLGWHRLSLALAAVQAR